MKTKKMTTRQIVERMQKCIANGDTASAFFRSLEQMVPACYHINQKKAAL